MSGKLHLTTNEARCDKREKNSRLIIYKSNDHYTAKEIRQKWVIDICEKTSEMNNDSTDSRNSLTILTHCFFQVSVISEIV
jgi:hypothetical protein